MFRLKNFLRDIDPRVWWILALAAAMIFFRIAHVDMVGDDAHYSVRAIGLADFMFGDDFFQSTPLHWFERVPWWAGFSFHDHPLLLFLIQHAFLSVHESIFFAKLPYALFGLGTLFLLYLLVRRVSGNAVAVFSVLFLALNAHWVWASRVAYMESGVMFFLLLALVAYGRFLEAPATWWWRFGAACGLALSAKFTTLFLVPTILLHLGIFHRRFFAEKYVWLAVSVAGIVSAPTLLYNFFLYQSRGHFSLQFARLFGQEHPWRFGGITATDFGQAFRLIGENLGALMSWPLTAAFAASVCFLVYSWRKHALLLFGIGFLTTQQLLIGQGGYVLALYSVFVAMAVGIGAHAFLARFPAARFLVVAFAAYLGVFVVNSHALGRHFGSIGVWRSQATSDNFGVYQLDRFLTDLIRRDAEIGRTFDIYHKMKRRDPRLAPYLARASKETMEQERAHAVVVLYDNNLNWFSRVWLFERRRFYENLAFLSIAEEHLFSVITINRFYFVKATEAAPLDSVQYRTETAAELESRIIAAGITPELIRRDDGEVAFRVYTIPSEKLELLL